MRKWLPVILIVAAVVATVMVYARLPEQMPTHWGVSGEADGWSSRLWGAWMIPLMMPVIWLIMRAIPHIDPRKANYEKFAGTYDALVSLILAFMLVMHIAVLMAGLGRPGLMERFAMPAVGLFIAAMGFLLPRARPNWFVGIRTPWTLTSDLSWERTHRIGGILFIALGILMAGASLVAPVQAIAVLVVAAIAIVVFLFVYSYRVWKEDPAKR